MKQTDASITSMKSDTYRGSATVWIAMLLTLLVGACESGIEGEFTENQPPNTSLTVQQINRSGEDRLSSQINISWWGDDPDGFVQGYEVAINDSSESAWTFTRSPDSTFILPIPLGEDTADVTFYVRAVDDQEARDPSPASLEFPIKNSPPEVSFVRNPFPPEVPQIPPDTTYRIASFGWTSDDIDGQGNLAYSEITLNDPDGEWLEIPIEENFVTIRANDNTGAETTANIFLGTSYRASELELPGLQLDQDNIFYVRTVDRAGAVSIRDSVVWHVKRQTSRILFLNDDAGGDASESVSLHTEAITAAGLSFDYWDISDGSADRGANVQLSERFPAVVDPTLRQTLAEWDHIFWLSNSMNRNINYAQDIGRDFFENGGTMFVTIPMIVLPEDEPIFNFLPIAELGRPDPGNLETGFAIGRNREVSPTPNVTSAPVLQTNRTITGTPPLRPITGADSLYKADFFVTKVDGSVDDYTAFEYVAIKNPEGNLIYFGLDLADLDGNDNLDALMQRMLIDELGFQP